MCGLKSVQRVAHISVITWGIVSLKGVGNNFTAIEAFLPPIKVTEINATIFVPNLAHMHVHHEVLSTCVADT